MIPNSLAGTELSEKPYSKIFPKLNDDKSVFIFRKCSFFKITNGSCFEATLCCTHAAVVLRQLCCPHAADEILVRSSFPVMPMDPMF